MNQSQNDRITVSSNSVFATIGIVVAVVLGATVGASTVAATPAQPGSDQYSVIQGDECVTIEPLGHGHQTAEEFYDYRSPNESDRNASDNYFTYSSHGTRNLQQDDTSVLFLFDGYDGLSLGMVHDRLDGNTSGGAVTMQVNDLPEDGEWVVEDDSYDGNDDEFDHRETSSRMTWVYTEERTDGAMFNGGLEDDFAIEIVPFFNENADYQEYDGELTEWQLVSGPSNDIERISLATDEPIIIQSGGCDGSSVTDITVGNDDISAGEPVTVEATVENSGAGTVTETVQFTVDDEVVDRKEVELGPDESTTVESSIEFNESGTYTVGANDQTTDVTVGGGSAAEEVPGFGVTAAALGALLIALFARTRS